MSQFDDDDDYDNEPQDFNSLRRAKRKDEKRIKELESELSSFRSEKRKSALAGAIEAAGLNPKIAAFVPETIDTGSIAEWIAEYGDVFTPASAAPPVPQPDPDDLIPDGAQQFNEVASAGTPPLGDDGQIRALIEGAKTPEELNRILGIG